MINKFSRFTALMAFSLAVLFFTSFQISAAVNDVFTIDDLKYTVLTEEEPIGTVSVSGNKLSLLYHYHVNIPATVENNNITYKVTSIESFGGYYISEPRYPHKMSRVTIPDSITSIGNGAFLNCFNLKNVTIGDGVTTIGNGAFRGCRSLTSITIGKSVSSIGSSLFSGCESLTNVYYRGDFRSQDYSLYGVAYIYNQDNFTIYYPKGNPSWENAVENGKWKWYNVVPYPVEDNLVYRVLTRKDTEVTLAVVDYIGASADVVIPSSFEGGGLTCYVTEIADRAFHKSEKLQKVEIPSSIKYIGDEAFSGCMNLKEINIPNSVESIGFGAFAGCRKLESAVFAGNTKLEGSVFYDCQLLSKVVFPETIEEIGAYTFARCKRLQSIHLPDTVANIGDSAFYGCKSLTEIIIPESVTEIGDSVFASCTNLASAIIPDSVASIGSFVFSECDKLPSVLFSTGKKILVRYSPSNTESSYTIPDTVTYIAGSAFFRCTDLESIKIPDTVTGIGDNAFCGCRGLTQIEIPNSVISIGNCSFDTCDSLKSIIIPDSVVSIGDNVFYHCSSLESVDIGRSVDSIKYTMFSECTNLSNITISSDNPVYSSLDGVLFNKDGSHLIVCPAGRKGAYILPDNVNTIEDHAFSDCRELTSITIPGSVFFIGNGAFEYCNCLTNINVGNGVKSIGDEVFRECMSLTNITIPNSVTSIGYMVFYGCSSLTQITVDSSNQNYSSIDGVLFNKDQTILIQYPTGKKDESYTIPNSVASIGVVAFECCSSLKNITIPDSVTSIGWHAFYECSSLTGVYFEGNEPTKGWYAFDNTPATIYYREGTEGWTNPWGGRPTALWVEATEIIEQPQSQSAVEGNPVTFTVSTTGTTPLSYQWQKDGMDIFGATDASYTIDNVKPTDAGSYRVVVSNSAGSVTSGAAVLTVRYLGTATISMNSVNPVTYGASCGDLIGMKVSSDIWGSLLYNGQEIARQVFTSAAAGKPTGKLKGGIIETDLLPAGTEVTLQLAAFDQGYLDHPDAGHYYYGISKPFTYKTGDSKTIQPDSNLLFDSFTVEWVETPVDEPVIRFELEGDGESLTLDFVGTLYESEDAVTWHPVEGAKAPFKVDITRGKKFYRCAQ